MTEPTDELSQLEREIPSLHAAAERARQLWVEADTALRVALRRRDELAWARLAPRYTPPPVPPTTAAPTAVATGPETSARTVQNLLFVLGGLLLGIAAIVFTAVAWSTFGRAGRAMILAVVTALMLALPLLALRRKLRATAETFAAIGLLLVALDGWAAWSVGFVDLPLARYAGVVTAVTATVALGYRLLTRLTGPAFAALAAAQPVLPLLALDAHPTPRVWVLIALAVSVMNLAVAAARTPVRELAFVAFGAAALTATVTALALTVSLASGALLVLCAAVLLAGALVSRVGVLVSVAAGWQMVAVLIGGSRYLAAAAPDHALMLIAALVAATVCLALAVVRYLPTTARPGLIAGSYVGAGTLALGVVAPVVAAASTPLGHALPIWSANLDWVPVSDWQLLVALLFACVALGAALPGQARPTVVVGAVVGVAIAASGAVTPVWWAAPVLDLAAAALLIAASSTVYGRSRTLTPPLAIGTGTLAAHALLASLARPELTAATLTALGVLGLAAAVRTPAPLRAAGIATAFAAVPPAVGAWLVAGDVADAWTQRLTVAAAIATVAALIPLRRTGLLPWAHAAASAGAAAWPLAVAALGAEPAGVYAAIGLLGVALALTLNPDRGTWVAAAAALPVAVLVAAVELEPVAGVVGLPFQWLGAIWTGVTGGTGLAPAGSRGPTVAWSDAIALAVVALASAAAAYARTRRIAFALAGLAVGAPTAVLLAIAVAGAAWPGLPAATLLLGLAGLVAGATAPFGPGRTALIAGQGLAYTGAGMAPLLAARWSTLVGLALLVVAGAVIGTAGRSVVWRVAGHLGAVAAAVSAASAAMLATDLALQTAAYPVLAVAGAALAYGASRKGRREEGRALEAAAHAAAVVALIYTIGWPDHAASICALWGLVIGARALWPGTSRAGRAALAAAAGAAELLGWWLLLAAREVSLTEAYTLPLAAVALLAGIAAVRSRPELRSWVAYGPALAAGFLPTLATVLVGPGEPWRRLALGAGALVVIIVGATRRLRAPVITGGAVLAAVAIHELALVWQLLPSWSPLAVGGAILVGLAITYERRRRDLARLRTALTRMH
jgi:hypothetical protein